jgi:hypothetical protein
MTARLGLAVCLSVLPCALFAEDEGAAHRRIVFDEQQIEGKIRRPQLVLIKAEQRPAFAPMVMQSLAGNTSVVEFVNSLVVEESPYDGAFRFNGTRISNYVP